MIFFIAFFLQTKKDKTRKVKVLLVHYVLATMLMVYATWKAFNQQDNRWLYNLLCFQSSVLICFYFHELFYGAIQKFAVKCLIAINVCYFIGNDVIFRRLFLFDSIGYSLLSVSVSILAFMYFYDVFKKVSEKKIWHDFNFWLVSGYLLYFLVSFGIFLTYHYLTNKILDTYTDEERGLLTVLWVVHNTLLFLSAITTLSGSLWITYRNR